MLYTYPSIIHYFLKNAREIFIFDISLCYTFFGAINLQKLLP